MSGSGWIVKETVMLPIRLGVGFVLNSIPLK